MRKSRIKSKPKQEALISRYCSDSSHERLEVGISVDLRPIVFCRTCRRFVAKEVVLDEAR